MFTIQKPTISSPAFHGIRVAPIIKVVLYQLLFVILSFYHLSIVLFVVLSFYHLSIVLFVVLSFYHLSIVLFVLLSVYGFWLCRIK